MGVNSLVRPNLSYRYLQCPKMRSIDYPVVITSLLTIYCSLLIRPLAVVRCSASRGSKERFDLRMDMIFGDVWATHSILKIRCFQSRLCLEDNIRCAIVPKKVRASCVECKICESRLAGYRGKHLQNSKHNAPNDTYT